ncbi:DUF4834 family protein [Olleya marilimosa]|jgi:hypothetical protein|uniref:DUF4834 family protein n=1 Tax=Olleya marilimosa TaxID=272164 RepID=A0ABR8LPE4_9FLAO|nr:DUF4834 family protein [Olleya marilimosa]MBD3862085.1 DUF4834 family protein [Olleya marilimosa]MBD3889579.1 DUF4834 family protein [Olleya marilimosa]PIB32014.1 DUF4834 domain-containing protein [Gaetbulibacter sp. 5U11]
MKFILYLLLFYFAIKILSRLFAPALFKYAAKKATERFGGAFNQQRQEPAQKEGEITIDKMPNNKSSNKNVGEYVDYEEIE